MDMPEFDLPPPELVIPLDPPITVAGMSCESLALKEPTAGQVRTAEGFLRGGYNPEAVRKYELSLIGSVTQLKPQVVDLLPASVQRRAADYLQGFIAPRPATGQTSSEN